MDRSLYRQVPSHQQSSQKSIHFQFFLGLKTDHQHVVKMQGTTLLVDRFRPEGGRHQNKIMRIISTEVKNADHVTINKELRKNCLAT